MDGLGMASPGGEEEERIVFKYKTRQAAFAGAVAGLWLGRMGTDVEESRRGWKWAERWDRLG